MSIDTNNEKLALITLLQPWNTPIPISSDGIGQDDKQHLLAGYPGILWSEGGGEGSTSYQSTLAILISIIFGGNKWG